MLVLTLKKHEKVYITVEGRTIGLMVTGYQNKKTCLGISAPKDVSVLREGAKTTCPKEKPEEPKCQ